MAHAAAVLLQGRQLPVLLMHLVHLLLRERPLYPLLHCGAALQAPWRGCCKPLPGCVH